MFYSEKMTHLQGLVSGDAKSLIRQYGSYGSKNYLARKHLSKKRLRKPDEESNFYFLRLENISSPTLQHNRSYMELAKFRQTMVDTFTKLGFQHDFHSTLNWSTSANLTHIQHQVSIIDDCVL